MTLLLKDYNWGKKGTADLIILNCATGKRQCSDLALGVFTLRYCQSLQTSDSSYFPSLSDCV